MLQTVKDRLEARRRQRAPVLRKLLAHEEMGIILGTQRTWVGVLPVKEWLAHVDQDARVIPNATYRTRRQLIMAALMAVVCTGFLYPLVMLAFNLQGPYAYLYHAVLAVLLGAPVGVVGGWFLGRIGQQLTPFWLVKRYWNDEAKKWDIYPVLHSSPVAQVHRADFMFDAEKMRDEKDFVKGGGGRRDKIEFVSLLTLGGALIAGVILFAMATPTS